MSACLRKRFLSLGLALMITGCSPWQRVDIGLYLQRPDLVEQDGLIRVTTVY